MKNKPVRSSPAAQAAGYSRAEPGWFVGSVAASAATIHYVSTPRRLRRGVTTPNKLDEPATKRDLEELAQATDSAIRTEAESLRGEIQSVRDGLRGELHEVRDELKGDIAGMKGDITSMKDDIASLQSGQQAILEVVQSIDQQLKEHRDLPERVARLKRTVYR